MKVLLKKQLLHCSVIVSLLTFNSHAFAGKTNASTENVSDDVAKLIQALFPLKGKSNLKNFKTQKCKNEKEKWMMLLLGSQPFTSNVKFNKQCDMQGSYTAKLATPFPINFKLRNLKKFNAIKGNILIKFIFEPSPQIQLELQNTKLMGEPSVTFNANYAVEVEPLGQNPIKKDLGGQVFIKKINGKKINKKYPLKLNIKS
jgi:hypothetical protein